LDLATHQDRYAATSTFGRPEDVLVIAASDDRGFTSREREALLAAYPGARAYVFATGGHLAAVTHPTEYGAVVESFLKGHPLPAVWSESPAAAPRLPATQGGQAQPVPAPVLDARLAAFRASHQYRTLDVDGVPWRYLAGGSGGQTVLLPAGGTRLPDMYVLLIEALERDFRVIAPAYPAGAGLIGLADGLAAILDAEGVRQADVLGSSFGGFVAQTFVRRHPGRVRRLVLANTGSPVGAPLPLKWRRWFVPESGDAAQFWNRLLSDVLGRLGKEDLLSGLREMTEFAQLPDEGTPSGRTTVPPIPVLLIESERDEAFSPQARAALRARYPSAEVRLFAGAGHGVMATRTAEYIGAVREFLLR
jgi:pimeloyl-ACP methyl ester carboxylesterase